MSDEWLNDLETEVNKPNTQVATGKVEKEPNTFIEGTKTMIAVEDIPQEQVKQIAKKSVAETSFKFEESENFPQEVYTIYGLKGDGKTALSYSFPGTKAVLSFDRKSITTKENMYVQDKNIKVYDAIKYLEEDPDKYIESSTRTYEWCLFLLENMIKEKPDWVIIDGLEIFTRVGEMVMRGRHGLKPFQGVMNRNVWKDRRLILRNLHKMAIDACKKGVIYTTYTQKDDVVDDGTLVSSKDVPKWTDIVMEQTDAVIHVYGKQEKDGKKFFAEIVTSKNDKKMKTGRVIDITDFKTKILEGE